MEKSSSPLDTLRQLRELLDAGTITPQEFETLKSRLLATPTVPLNPTFTTPPEASSASSSTHPEPAPTTPSTPNSTIISSAEPPAVDVTPGYGSSYAAAPQGSSASVAEPEPADTELYEEPEVPRSPLGLILAIGGGLLLLGLIWYLVMGQSRSSEHLTSISQTAADSVATTPETGPQAEQLELPPVAAPETVRVAPVVPATPDSVATAPATTPDAAASAPTEPAPVENTTEATNRVRDMLAAYYTDLQAAPFNASQYFAPQVELFVVLRNTTPAAISTWLDQNRFPEFKETQLQIEPGTLKVTPATADGSRVVTYVEEGRAFRQSLQKNQHIRAQMRVRINSDYKITYQKQERLLENTFSDVEAPE